MKKVSLAYNQEEFGHLPKAILRRKFNKETEILIFKLRELIPRNIKMRRQI